MSMSDDEGELASPEALEAQERLRNEQVVRCGYLLKKGEQRRVSFSTFPCSCCVARALSLKSTCCDNSVPDNASLDLEKALVRAQIKPPGILRKRQGVPITAFHRPSDFIDHCRGPRKATQCDWPCHVGKDFLPPGGLEKRNGRLAYGAEGGQKGAEKGSVGKCRGCGSRRTTVARAPFCLGFFHDTRTSDGSTGISCTAKLSFNWSAYRVCRWKCYRYRA